ncbi:glutathione synthase [Derxia gummosa]|uniref:Glutathione synthetase n=1 Tax=Derxia gummosa DSM 723 TaxID=1121388 RepID=A0A8B6X5R4_9BURK|nr:glutathione synthase [Derxia gummosa]
MRIAFIADPLEQFRIYKDSTFAMMEAAAKRGHELWAILQPDMAVVDARVVATARRIVLTGVAHDSEPHDPRADWFAVAETADIALADFDAVVMRKDPPFDMEYVYSTFLLERAEAEGARVFNKPRAIRDHNEKLAITEFPQYTAPTIVTRSLERVRAFHAEHRDVILKPLDGMGGMGIFRVRDDGLNLGSIFETLTRDGARTIMVQRYIPEIVDGDKRVLLIAGQPVPFCLARIPMAGETRGNLAAGGTGVARPLSERDREIATGLAPTLWARGLMLVGLDVIGANLTEINVTSPTCFREIMDQTGFDVAGMMIDAIERARAAG